MKLQPVKAYWFDGLKGQHSFDGTYFINPEKIIYVGASNAKGYSTLRLIEDNTFLIKLEDESWVSK